MECTCVCVQPALGIRSRSELGKLLKRYDDEGLGCVTMSDVREALPKPEKAVKVSRPVHVSVCVVVELQWCLCCCRS